MTLQVDIVYDKHIIFYNNSLDCKISAYLLREYIHSNIGTTPIAVAMEHGDTFRLESISEDATVWVLGLDIPDEDCMFMNRYSAGVFWYPTEDLKINKGILINFTVDDDMDKLVSERIYEKYYDSNDFMDKYIKAYYSDNSLIDYLSVYIDRSTDVENYFYETNFGKYINKGHSLRDMKSSMLSNMLDNAYIQIHEGYTYYVINTDCFVEEVIAKAMKRTNTVICVYHYNRLNNITVHVASNCLSLASAKSNYKAKGTDYKINFKTNTVNVIYLDIPNSFN